jgi:hypothetical protein
VLAECRSVCSNTCARADDGHCTDGWDGDSSSEGFPRCRLGTDCHDCGKRELCSVGDAAPHLLLPRQVLSTSSAPLRAVHVLFMIMGSSLHPELTVRAHSTWCRSQNGARCLFVTDNDAGWPVNHTLPLLTVSTAKPPGRCCGNQRTRSGKRKGFFCTSHRLTTLRAQYRFLPTLRHVKGSAAFASGVFRWLVLVDDDSFVFLPRLLRLLAWLDHTKPLCALMLT